MAGVTVILLFGSTSIKALKSIVAVEDDELLLELEELLLELDELLLELVELLLLDDEEVELLDVELDELEVELEDVELLDELELELLELELELDVLELLEDDGAVVVLINKSISHNVFVVCIKLSLGLISVQLSYIMPCSSVYVNV